MSENSRLRFFRCGGAEAKARLCIALSRISYAVTALIISTVEISRLDLSALLILRITTVECVLSALCIAGRQDTLAIAFGCIGCMLWICYTSDELKDDKYYRNLMYGVFSNYMVITLIPMLVMFIVKTRVVDEDEIDIEEAVRTSNRIMPQAREATGEEGEVCCICLGSMNPPEHVSNLKCAHVMHQLCLEKWLKIHPANGCPVCRDKVDASSDIIR